MYDAPSATTADTGRMTIDDVVMRTASLFVVLLVTAAPPSSGQAAELRLILVARLVGLRPGLWISFSKTIRPPLMFAYAAVEGVFVGGISSSTSSLPGIVVQAVLGTLATFAAMLALYRFKVIRATPEVPADPDHRRRRLPGVQPAQPGLALFSGNSVYASRARPADQRLRVGWPRCSWCSTSTSSSRASVTACPSGTPGPRRSA
jgi:hypothetical protein